MTAIVNRHVDVDGFDVFYREAGKADAPVVLLLHGFPSSSHMFRDLIPHLADTYRVVAPDLPGFGQSARPSRERFNYTFDNLTNVIDRFTEVIGLKRFAIYIFDYGSPVGLRLATRHPERITAIVSQNGNAYVEGLSDGWSPIQKYWREPTLENRDGIRQLLTPETTKWQYTHGVDDPTRVSPDGYSLDNYYMAQEGMHEIQLDLFLDYANNVELYPKFHEYFRKHQPPLLAVWGRHDPFFLPAGAQAFERDNKNAVVKFFDTGHFALETHAGEIAMELRQFLARALSDRP